MEAVYNLRDPVESNGPETFQGLLDGFSGPEEMGPDVIMPVVGRIGASGSELWRETEFPPPGWGPEDFFTGSPCLLRGPEVVFFTEAEPGIPADETEPGWFMELDRIGLEWEAAPE